MLRARVTAPKPRVVALGATILVALRVFAVLLGLELAGVGHAVVDLVECVAAEAGEAHEQCPPDGACDDCPPGCPSCHCANRVTSVAPNRAPLPSVVETPPADAWLRFAERGVSPGPEPSSVYRPPRSSTSLA
jgi:hypothetical protein